MTENVKKSKIFEKFSSLLNSRGKYGTGGIQLGRNATGEEKVLRGGIPRRDGGCNPSLDRHKEKLCRTSIN